MSLLAELLDVIYPPRCPGCQVFFSSLPGEDARGFCARCRADFRLLEPPLCRICGHPFAGDPVDEHYCEECLLRPPLYEAVRAPYAYDGVLMECIHRFKFGGRSSLAKPLAALLAEFVEEWPGRIERLLIIPVPLHPRKLRERGFNQSLLLARPVAGALGSRLDFLSLRRIRYTRAQTGLKKDERRKNVRKAFGVAQPGKVEGRTILVVDDVTTTGTTLNECARALMKAGADRVLGLTLARRL